jgi:hypothetical protein
MVVKLPEKNKNKTPRKVDSTILNGQLECMDLANKRRGPILTGGNSGRDGAGFCGGQWRVRFAGAQPHSTSKFMRDQGWLVQISTCTVNSAIGSSETFESWCKHRPLREFLRFFICLLRFFFIVLHSTIIGFPRLCSSLPVTNDRSSSWKGELRYAMTELFMHAEAAAGEYTTPPPPEKAHVCTPLSPTAAPMSANHSIVHYGGRGVEITQFVAVRAAGCPHKARSVAALALAQRPTSTGR